ncbi:hypothetical protein [Paenibacillus typhae]|uniref:hypothetical protein n=1 Tax=Paenibacillus typhae TaxID=1174501 RepID=UPI001C8E7F12|nr:hypothetical protein [Paenibacillus typhae]MBY0014398.1 hypothetical protein [Paenibacillus typhae]
MNAIMLPSVQFRAESLSFTDALYGVLAAKGWFSLPKPMLAGMTGACFRFSVHRQLHADSATAYNWMAEHLVACDLIGVTASQWGGYNFTPTFPLYQRQAVRDIKSSIDRGNAAVLWKDRFVIVNGYHEAKQLFYYLDGRSAAVQELSFAELGLNQTPYCYYQVYEHLLETDVLQVIKESYMQAVFRAETPDIMLPGTDYACGLSAYDAILNALQSGNYDAAGAYETISVYAAAKRDAAQYTRFAAGYWAASQEVAGQYAELAILYEKMLASAEMNSTPGALSKPGSSFIDFFHAARAAETAAIRSIRTLLHEPIANRFHDVGLR